MPVTHGKRFSPVQYINPARISPGILYQEIPPAPALSDYVATYWTVQSKYPLLDEVHRVIPDGCADIIFNLAERMVFVSGMADSTEFLVTRGTIRFFGIRFLPNAVPFLLGLNSSESLNQKIESAEIHGTLREMAQRVLGQNAIPLMTSIVDEYLGRFFADYRINRRFQNLLNCSLESRGWMTVGELARANDLSERQTRRYFQEYLGISTKAFLRIVRFQNTLQSLGSGSRSSPALAADHGFYDQSHLIKELDFFLGSVKSIY